MSTGDVRRALVAIALSLGCASARPQGVADLPLRTLEAPRFQRAVQEALDARGLQLAPGRRVRIASRREVACAACVAGTHHCVAFVTTADRATLGPFLPQRAEPGVIVSAPGTESDRGAQVLVLDEEDLRYQPDPSRASAAEPTVTEIEDRVRRAVLDWLAWLASQGSLPAR